MLDLQPAGFDPGEIKNVVDDAQQMFAGVPDSVGEAPLRFCLAPGDADLAALFGELARQSIQGRPIQTRQLVRRPDVTGLAPPSRPGC